MLAVDTVLEMISFLKSSKIIMEKKYIILFQSTFLVSFFINIFIYFCCYGDHFIDVVLSFMVARFFFSSESA